MARSTKSNPRTTSAAPVASNVAVVTVSTAGETVVVTADLSAGPAIESSDESGVAARTRSR
jgi:hypothetical protein